MTARPRVGSEGGFTLIELLVAMSVGMVVLLAVFAVFDSTLTASARVEDRTEAVQRGRTAMEQITQRLRSQACPNATTPAIEAGTDDAVTLYTDIGGAVFAPRRTQLSFSPAANGSLVQTLSTPSETRLVLTNVSRMLGFPVFRYYAFAGDGTVSQIPLATPLAAADRGRVVKIAVSFVSRATRTPTATDQELAFQNSVYVRTADPSNPGNGPLCG